MSVIIRLQNLPWSANALDIRQFFHGLSIPEGGVHIVGGELGDAFIAFSTDEDARQAFNRNGGKIKEIQVKLMLSSRTEMQKVIEAARNPLAAFMQTSQQAAAPPVATIMPSVMPATVPETKKENSKESDRDRNSTSRRRSRSRSRDRKERSRDRDRKDSRRKRDKSRSKSRERRDRRRRDRSRSRDRTRSKERDRRNKDGKRSEDRTGLPNKQKPIGVWEPPPQNLDQPVLMPNQQNAVGLLNNLVGNSLEEIRRNMVNFKPVNAMNNPEFQPNPSMVIPRNRDQWHPNAGPFRNDNHPNYHNRNPDDPNLYHNDRQFHNQGRNFPNRPMNYNENERIRPLIDRQEITGSCVQLQPFYGSYNDIRRFFQGFFISNTGMKFVTDEYGKRTGLVYVRFFYPEDKSTALTKDGAMLKGNMVEVKHLDEEMFEENTQERYGNEEYKEEEMGHNNHSYGFRGGRNNGRNFNNRPLQNFPPTPKIFSCLVVEDLPNYAKEQDILKMFGEYSLMLILMVTRQKQHVAYVKFSNKEDAKKALTEKQIQAFDGKPVAIRGCSEEEFNEINREHNDLSMIEDKNGGNGQMVEESTNKTSCIAISGLPLKTIDRDIVDFFSDIGVRPETIHMHTNHLGFTGTAYCEFATLQDAAAALEKDGIPLGPKEVSISLISKEEMESRLGMNRHQQHKQHSQQGSHFSPRNHQFMPRGMGMMGPRGPGGPMRRFPPHYASPVQNASDIGIPGCTVLMENVPYKSGLDEILKFFEGFEIPPDNILRRYNENGTPSGEAKVIFSSHEEAAKAVEQNRYHKIRERTIYLTLC